MRGRPTLLVLNSGSSSMRFAVFDAEPEPRPLYHGHIDRIGTPAARAHVVAASDGGRMSEPVAVANHAAGVARVFEYLERLGGAERLIGVGHRIVHGAMRYHRPVVVDAEVEAALRAGCALAPLHQSNSLAGIEAVRATHPHLPQVACFDTAFHADLPEVARETGLPRDYTRRGVQRYGYHGLSYESVIDTLRREQGAAATAGRLVIAHLGNGASLAAVRDGRAVDTTMGFSVLDGLLMGTRCGEIDPGILLYLLKNEALSVDALERLLYEGSGLLGVSGVAADLRTLLGRGQEPDAGMAIDLFCYKAIKALGSMVAVLGGLDRLVFTGGIGENAASIRARLAGAMAYLGLCIDPASNSRHERVISAPESAVTVQVVAADEALVIARHAHALLQGPGAAPA